MTEKTWVFFYGTFMHSEVLRNFGIDCETTLPAKIRDYKLTVQPRVNLEHHELSLTYGGLAHITHEDIALLYDDLVKNYGITYHPYPVIAELVGGSFQPALSYISFDIENSKPDPTYIRDLVKYAKLLNSPSWYIEHIQSFGGYG